MSYKYGTSKGKRLPQMPDFWKQGLSVKSCLRVFAAAIFFNSMRLETVNTPIKERAVNCSGFSPQQTGLHHWDAEIPLCDKKQSSKEIKWKITAAGVCYHLCPKEIKREENKNELIHFLCKLQTFLKGYIRDRLTEVVFMEGKSGVMGNILHPCKWYKKVLQEGINANLFKG